MNIDQMTIGDFKELQKAFATKRQRPFPHKVGEQVFIRSVTLYYTGRISKIEGEWVTLEDAAWIADTGRFHEFLKDGTCNEYEAFLKPVSIPVSSIIDVSEWEHKLFRGNK